MARTAVIAGTATAVSGRVARRQDERSMAEQEQMARADEAPTPPEPSASAAQAAGGPSAEDIEQLKQLGALKDQGILTEEEFAAEKGKILAR
jgi:hypothetical protein